MDSNLKYNSIDYWNERYQHEESYEWFGDYKSYKQVINKHVRSDHSILVLGCGNSKMSEQMYFDGYENIVNTDYSQIVIDLMSERCKILNKMKWMVMDINNLEFKDESFDCVLEKGTLDALLVDEKDPWNLSEVNAARMDKICENVSRILKPNGVFISITFAQPHFRKPIFACTKFQWSIKQYTIGETFHYFVYVMTKGEQLEKKDTEFYCRKNLNINNDSKLLLLDIETNENYLNKIDLDSQ